MKKKKFRIDRSALSVTSLHEQDEEDIKYWKNKTPHQRLEAVEIIRQILYDYDPETTRIKKVIEVTKLK